MPQVTAASAHAFLALLEHHELVPHFDKKLLCHCKFVTKRIEIAKDMGGWCRMLDDVNKCRALCMIEIVKFTEYIDILDIRFAGAERQLGPAVELSCYKDPLGIVKKTREECAKQKEQYNDAMMALLFAKEEIKAVIDDMKHAISINDQEWVWVSDEYCFIHLKDWVDVEAEADA